MIAVTDTSPLCYLILIGEIRLLAELFDAVLVPQSVIEELQHPGTPEVVSDWLQDSPPWLRIKAVEDDSSGMPQLQSLDPGERNAILLAHQQRADIVLLDDKAGREAAQRSGLRVTGTLGLLEQAARRGHLALPSAIARLRETNFRAAPSLLKALLNRNR